MKLLRNTLATLVVLLSLIGYTHAQTEKLDVTGFGVGVYFAPFKITDLRNETALGASNKFLMSYTPTSWLRVEPQVGFIFSGEKDGDYTANGVQGGTGVFGMWQKGKTNFYCGGRVEYLYEKTKTDGYEGTTGTYKRLTVGPTIGAEYFFGSFISLGAEINLQYNSQVSREENESYDYEYELNSYFFTPETAVILRIYF